MMSESALYNLELHCIALYCTLHCFAQHCIALYCTLYCNVLNPVVHCTARCTALYCSVLHCPVLYCTVLYCTVLYCTELHWSALQERRVSCVALSWLGDCVAAAACTAASSAGGAPEAAAAAAVAAAAASGAQLDCGVGGGVTCQLLLFPRSHLDLTSLTASYTLPKARQYPCAVSLHSILSQRSPSCLPLRVCSCCR